MKPHFPLLIALTLTSLAHSQTILRDIPSELSLEEKKRFDRNDSWATALSQAQTKLSSLAEIERASDFYRNVQPADIDPLIKQYLPRERASIGTALPDKK